MKRNRKRQVTAMAMAVMMAAASFNVSGIAMPVYAAEQSDEIHFPDVYAKGLVQPIKDQETINKKVNALLKTMTTEEKYTFLGGNGTGDTEGNAGYLKGVPRLGVPMIKMYDGPAGLLYPQDTTNPPQEQMLAATWDESMAEMYGEAVGNENLAIGGCMMLSAQLDIQRQPQFQRTKDQMGEDPYLLSSMADDLVNGMTKNGGIAVLKHYGAFAQNASPGTNTNVEVSEQALHETYLAGFESAIKTNDSIGVMSSYNKLSGTWASASTELQENILHNMWGFDGFTITDWGGNHEYTLDKGTDVEMPSLSNNSQAKTQAKVDAGEMTQEEADALVDKSVKRVLTAYAKGGYLTLVQVDEDGYAKEEAGRTELIKPGTDNQALADLYDACNEAVEKVAEEGGVLLKNENKTLPLDTTGDKSVAVVGVNGMTLISGIGGERSYGSIRAMTSPYEALTDILGTDKVEGQVYNDKIGTIIPTENLYTTAAGSEHGAVRTYGTGKSAETGGNYQGQFVSNSVPETKMEGHEIGEFCQVDEKIDFNTNSKTYRNAEGGNAFDYTQNPAYTWTTYLEAPEDGEYSIILQSIGAKAAMSIYELDEDGNPTEKAIGSGSGASTNQGTQYYGGIIPSETGENLSTASVKLEAGKRYMIGIASENAGAVNGKDMQVGLAWVTPSQKQANIDNAIKAAENNDTVVVFAYAQVSDPKSTREATTLKLDAYQQTMIQNVAKAAHEKGNKVAVVLNNDSAVVMEDWIDDVDAILEMYYPGQRGGVATAKLLTGEVNPSGKLAYTIPKKDTDTLITISDEAWNRFEKEDETEDTEKQSDVATQEAGGGFPGGGFPGGGFPGGGFPGGGFPGFGGGKANTTYFDEGINTGYKWFDENSIEPQFDFGYGLSYTTFEYSDMSVAENATDGEVAGYDVTFTVTNTGDVAGSEVAQVYLGEAQVPEGIQTSKYALAGYEKVKDIQPGETREVTVHVSGRSLSYWNSNQEELNVNADGTKDKWTLATGDRKIYVGSASDKLLMEKTVDVEKQTNSIDMVKQGLSRMIALIESLNSSEYTKESWAAVEDALADAKEVQADKDATESKLTEVQNALLKAYTALEYGVQKTHLQILVDSANDILKEAANYENNAKTLKDAVAKAEKVLTNEDATQEEADAVMTELVKALQELSEKASVKSLKELIDAAKEMIESSNFTSASQKKLEDAVAKAEDVLTDGEHTSAELEKAYNDVIDAIINLERKGNKAALSAMIEKAEEVLADKDAYVASTIDGLDAILANAKAVNENEDATQNTVDNMVKTLTLKVADARLKGDVDGDGSVGTSDSASLLQYAAEKITLDDVSTQSADVNGDGAADTQDAAMILQYAAEEITSF